MAKLISIPTYNDSRGRLSVIEDLLPSPVLRVFYIRGTEGNERGGKKHSKAHQCMVSIAGECRVEVVNSSGSAVYPLDTPEKGLLLQPGDWHRMYNFSSDNILLVLSTEKYNPEETSSTKPQVL